MSAKPRTRRGFGAVRKLPSGRYQASHLHEGTRYTARTPEGLALTFTTKLDANAWLAARQTAIARGEWPPAKPVAASTLTFGEYAEEWLASRPLTGRTPGGYRQMLDAHLLPTFGALRLRAIDARLVRDWHNQLGKRTGPSMTSHCYRLLSSIMRTAADDELIPANPVHIKGASSDERRRDVVPATLAQLDVIVERVPERYRAMILLAAWRALRFGELAELRRGDVDLEAGKIAITRAVVKLRGGAKEVKAPKSKAGIRTLSIPPHIMPALRDHLDRFVLAGDDALLFPSARDPRVHMDSTSLQAVWYPARAKAGRPDLRFHDLRHTGATMLAIAGATLAELKKSIGHSTDRAAMIYQHALDERDEQLATMLSQFAIDGAVGPRRRAS